MKLKVLPLLLNAISKIDLNDIVEDVKKLNINNVNEISNDVKTELGLMIIARIIPQLGRISEDIIPLVAAIKNISEEEAKEVDIVETFKEIVNNKGLVDFFTYALKNKIEQKS